MYLKEHLIEHRAHDASIWSTAWCPNNQYLTGSLDESVKLWTEDNNSIKKVHTFIGHNLGVNTVDVHKGGEYGASSSLDGFVRIWSIKDKHSVLQILENPPAECWGINFAPMLDKLIIAVAGGLTGNVEVWELGQNDHNLLNKMNIPDKRSEAPILKRSHFVLTALFSPDSKYLTGTSDEGSIGVFDHETGKILHSYCQSEGIAARASAFTPDAKVFLTGNDSNIITFLDIQSGDLTDISINTIGYTTDISFHPDGKHFVSASSNGKLYLWDFASKQIIEEYLFKDDFSLWGAKFSPCGQRIITVSDDGLIIMYKCL